MDGICDMPDRTTAFRSRKKRTLLIGKVCVLDAVRSGNFCRHLGFQRIPRSDAVKHFKKEIVVSFDKKDVMGGSHGMGNGERCAE
jgi:hypothetical protein